MLSNFSLAVTSLGWMYNVVLVGFRASVNELEWQFSSSVYGLQSAIHEFLGFTAMTGVAGLLYHYSTTSKTDSNIAYMSQGCSIGLIAASVLLIRRINRNYVQGRKFAPVDLSGKVFIVTGCNTGIGFETTKEIVKMNGSVVMACRSLDKANQAREALISELNCAPNKLIVLQLDLCSFSSVRNFVKEFHKLSMPLHCLVNNAGLMIHNRMVTKDGLEMVLTANHLSHFLLSNLLLPDLEKSINSVGGSNFVPRIVTLSSALHHNASKGIKFNDIMYEEGYELFATYSQSKLANILFTKGLQKRLTTKGSPVACHSVHPGCVRTEVTRHMHPVMQFLNALAAPLMWAIQKTPQEGAYCSIHVCSAPDPAAGPGGSNDERKGLHFFHCEPVAVSAAGMDGSQADRLWDISTELTALDQQ